MHSFVAVSAQSHFPLQNLPYGIFSTPQDPIPRIGVAIGDHILDLKAIRRAGLFNGPHLQGKDCFEQATLNSFMALGRPAWTEARSTLQCILSADEAILRDNTQLREQAIVSQSSATMHLPASIGDYTDFYCSKEHATNCGIIFRGPDTPLRLNWLHHPVGYHGRASSIVVSGTDVRRPWGQVQRIPNQPPTFEPCAILDFELEMGCFIGPGNDLGSPISIDSAKDHMFGFVLLNDWSARDIQFWESQPLGPCNSKNWATSISPWVVTLDALGPFKVPAPPQDPVPLPYLRSSSPTCNYDIRLEASITPESSTPSGTPCPPSIITNSNMRTLYWTLPQMITHHTAGGCNLQPGDVIGTGTLSTEGSGGQGCMLELSWNGTREIVLENGGGNRTFLEDGDTVTLTGYCQGEGYRVGFGECKGKVLPALALK